MQEQRLLWLLIFIGFSAFSQTKGIVVDEKNQPIPYVNIWVENASKENGTFQIDVSDNDIVLVFSSIGFETKRVKVSESQNVVMQSLIIALDEVIISKPKATKEIEVGDSKKRFYLPETQTAPWILARNLFPDEKNPELKYIKILIFFTNSEVDNAIFRARVFSITADGKPGEDMIPEEVIVKTKKGRRKTVVDVSAYKLQMPNEGVIVGFESLLTENNKYMQTAGVVNSKKTVKILNYGPHIMYNYMNTEESYAYRAGLWTKQLFSMYNENTPNYKKVIGPAINLILTN
jgi:hypothetical protein